MKHWHILLLLAVLAWPGRGGTTLQAQELPRSPLTPPSEETKVNPSDPPTPQLVQVDVDFGAGGPHVRLRIHPAWQGRYRPYVRVGQVRTAPQPEEETAPPPQGGADELNQALGQALDRAKPPPAP
jgi:hypothetical protein